MKHQSLSPRFLSFIIYPLHLTPHLLIVTQCGAAFVLRNSEFIIQNSPFSLHTFVFWRPCLQLFDFGPLQVSDLAGLQAFVGQERDPHAL